MKVIILAAGKGSRLDDSPHHLPKALTPLHPPHSILSYQIKVLTSYVPLDCIWVVVGYEKEAIMSAFPDLVYIFNPDFEKENTAKSLWRALRKVEEDVLWLNGDVVLHPTILAPLLEARQTGTIVNQAVVGEEEVKYCQDEQGRLTKLSKQIVSPQGEALGIYFFKYQDVLWLKECLEACQSTDFFEKGIEMGIEQGHAVWSFPIAKDECVEVDFPEDLKRAKELVQRWNLHQS